MGDHAVPSLGARIKQPGSALMRRIMGPRVVFSRSSVRLLLRLLRVDHARMTPRPEVVAVAVSDRLDEGAIVARFVTPTLRWVCGGPCACRMKKKWSW
jgi:hypothetical protein